MKQFLRWASFARFSLTLFFFKLFREVPVTDRRLLYVAGWTRARKVPNQFYTNQGWVLFTWRYDYVANNWELMACDMRKCDEMVVMRSLKRISDNTSLLLPHMVSYIWTELPTTHLEKFKLPPNDIAEELDRFIKSHQPN